MITRVARQALQSYLTWPALNTPNTAKCLFSESIKNTAGTTMWFYYMGNKMIYRVDFSRSATTSGVVIGSGNTPPTQDDYMLENLITSASVIGVVNAVRLIDDGKPCLIMNVTVMNESGETITIREIGLISYDYFCATSQTGGSASNQNVLVDRTLLTSPVTLASGDCTDIEYKIKVDMAFM